MKTVSILGSTGSIGCNTLKVIDNLADFRVAALAAGSNTDLLARQVERYRPKLVSCATADDADDLLRALRSRAVGPPRVEIGEAGLIAVATLPEAQTVVSATVGAVGFVPTLRAIEAGKRVALANKETLVMAGGIMTAAAKRSGSEILPVDSEHNALHQCLRGESAAEVRRLILTASGGPFREWPAAKIATATVADALNHPNWKMGEKVTIDSATLMNKGLEVIEAHWLFGFDAECISVVVHPQSVIHSMVEMIDGSIIAQLGVTDMKHAIQYALTFPRRQPGCMDGLDVRRMSDLTFEEPDIERFPCLELAYRALRAGGTAPAALNAANEIAVQAFLDGQIAFSDIARINRTVIDEHRNAAADTLESVIAADRSARASAQAAIAGNTAAQTV